MTSCSPYLAFDTCPWVETRDGDAHGRAIYRRHYSYRPYADARDPALFVGPGGKLVLIATDGRGLFVWRSFIDDATIDGERHAGPRDVCCSVFRNESGALSSALILQAEPFAFSRWPGTARLYTYVDPSKVRRKRDPGRCFLRAGWRRRGITKGGLVVLEKTS